MTESGLTCISTFSGLGGMDLGLEAAGFDVRACVEWDESARQSLKANRNGRWNLLPTRDIAEVAASLKPSDLGMRPGELDLLAGAPPCQPFSKAGQWTHDARQGLGDPRGQYLDDFLRLLETFRPKVALLENVRGFVQGRTSAVAHIELALSQIAARTSASYRLTHRLLDAAEYGVPQHRTRAIVVISRLDGQFEWPPVTEPTTAWDALGATTLDGELPQATGKWADLLPSIPEGENYLWHTNRGKGKRLFGYRTRYWSFLLKLAKDRPSWTLPAHPGPATGPFHWDNRPLSIQELLRLQSFPADWIVEGRSRRDHVRQIGNATPPLLAEALGQMVAASITGQGRGARELTLQVGRRRPIPPPSPVRPVPRKYLDLVADYEDHPGHGLGPGAADRSPLTPSAPETSDLPDSESDQVRRRATTRQEIRR